MTAPNLGNATTITGSATQVSLTTTSATSLCSNASSSNHSFKIESIIVANTTSSPANITINVYSASSLGGTAFPIASTISVPPNASLIVVDKTNSFYLLENQSIGATAGTANALVVLASWEDIS